MNCSTCKYGCWGTVCWRGHNAYTVRYCIISKTKAGLDRRVPIYGQSKRCPLKKEDTE